MAYNFRKNGFETAEVIAKAWNELCDRAERPLAKSIGSTEFDARTLSTFANSQKEFDEGDAGRIHFLMRWRSFGYPTFELTHSLASTLLLTDCSGIAGRDLKFPFPSFLIALPYPKSPIVGSVDSEVREIRHIIIHNMDMLDSADKAKAEEYLSKDDSLIAPNHLRYNKRTFKYLVSQKGLLPGTASVFPEDSESVEEWLSDEILPDIEDDRSASISMTLNSMMKAASRLIVNLCLYIDALQQNGHRLDKKTSLSKWKKSKRESGPALPPAWILGRDIKLSPELHAAARQVSNPKAKSCTAWQLQSQHVVRGHWKNQAYGPGRTLRKKIRIEPYWKGPRLSEAVLRSFAE